MENKFFYLGCNTELRYSGANIILKKVNYEGRIFMSSKSISNHF